VPPQMPDPPERIAAPYRQVARELDLPWRTIEEAGEAAMRFLNPVLKADSNVTKAKWNQMPLKRKLANTVVEFFELYARMGLF
jgi:hypothetical protein